MTPTLFRIHPTPLGDTLLLVSNAGLVGLEVLSAPLGAALDTWTRMLGALPQHDGDAAASIAGQLDEYFEGDRTAFEMPIDWSLTAGFTRAALQTVCEIPYGETASYGEVAAMAGSHRAHRAAGTACARTPLSVVVPVHRVVRSDGSIGEYGGRPEHKRFLLELEASVVGRVE